MPGDNVEFVAEGTGDTLFHICNLYTMPVVDQFVHLNGTEYKVEKVEVYLADDDWVEPVSGYTARWRISEQRNVVTLSVVP